VSFNQSMASTRQDEPRFEHGGHVAVRAPVRNAAAWHAYVARARDAQGQPCLQQRAKAAQALFADPALQEAIWLASASLLERLRQWNWLVVDDDDGKLLAAFDRYYNRMCFRPTPFGGFSTFSFASLGRDMGDPPFSSARLQQAAPRRVFTLDAELAFQLQQRAASLAPTGLHYAVNASLYRRGDRFRFVDWRQGKHGTRSYTASEAQWSEELAQVLQEVGRGPLSHAMLRSALGRVADCTAAEADELIAELYDCKVLVDAPGISFFGADACATLCAALPPVAELEPLRQQLRAELARLAAWPTQQAIPLQHYQDANVRLKQLFPHEMATTSCVQLDAFRALPTPRLDDSVLRPLVQGVGELFGRFGYRNNGLDRFTEQFVARYEHEFVPLVEVLDDEALLGQFDFNHQLSDKLGALDRILMEKMIAAGATGAPIRLRYQDIAKVPIHERAQSTPDLFVLAERIAAEQDGGAARFAVHTVMTGSSIGWLGRFAHGEAAVQETLRGVAQQVMARDRQLLHVEVAYMPAARMGNVMRRPLVWDHVVDLIEPTPHAGALPVSDLWLGKGRDGLELWSKSLNRPVMPHVTSAHNPKHFGNTSLYKFLRAYAMHNSWQCRLMPGPGLLHLDALPRVEYEGIVISPAGWTIAASEAGNLPQLLIARKVPRWVKLTDGDHSLVLDTHNAHDLAQLRRALKAGGAVFLQEYLAPAPDPDLPDAQSNHELLLPVHQASAPMHRRQWRKDFAAVAAYHLQPGFSRQLAPADMVYLKLYMAPHACDAFLEQAAGLLGVEGELALMVRSWFFIRYADPHHHIRLRLACAPQHYGRVMEALQAWLAPELASRRLDGYQFDQYRPEYGRYGGPQVTRLSEQLFWHDSMLCCASLHLRESHASTFLPLYALVHAVDRLLADAGCDYLESHAIVSAMASGFAAEFGVDKKARAALAAAYRKESQRIGQILAGDNDGGKLPWLEVLDQSWHSQRRARRALFRQCREQLQRHDEAWSVTEFLRSHVHMSCNRMVNDSRPWELRAYQFLTKAYYSLTARGARRRELAP
jgi:thiopeptide-type bacteriocin biosynthesis protein